MCTASTVVQLVDDWFRLSILVYSIKIPVALDRAYFRAGVSRWAVANLTRPCRPTLYALSVCMNARTSHFIMQTAIAYSAADGGVRFRKLKSIKALVYLLRLCAAGAIHAVVVDGLR